MTIENHVLNIAATDIDKPIYRIFSYHRFIQLFDENILTLVNPEMWEDPFENFIMKSNAKLVSGDKVTFGFRNDFYGQCWSFQKESDAMWRIYAPEKNGVKVKSTIRKLISSLYNTCNNLTEQSCFIGKVEYCKKEKIAGILNDPDLLTGALFDKTGRGQVETLLFKRFAFRHENEVRLIFHDQNGITPKKNIGLYQFNINPFDLFDEITFDPRMDRIKYNKYKNELTKRGFSKKIVRSGLYDVPNISIRLNI